MNDETTLIRDDDTFDECMCMKCGSNLKGDFQFWKFCPKCGRKIISTIGDRVDPEEDKFFDLNDFEEDKDD